MIQVLGLLSIYFLVGAGGCSLVVGGVARALTWNAKAAVSPFPRRQLIYVSSLVLGLICVAPSCYAWMYFLLFMPIGIAELLCLVVGAACAGYVYFRVSKLGLRSAGL